MIGAQLNRAIYSLKAAQAVQKSLMDQNISDILKWTHLDKALFVAATSTLLFLFYAGLIEAVALWTDFGRHYFSRAGLATTQKILLGSAGLWLVLTAIGAFLHTRNRPSPLYVQAVLYLFCWPLLLVGLQVGLYNPLTGVFLLGATLTGTLLFSFEQVLGPFLLGITALITLAYAGHTAGLTYAPLLATDTLPQAYFSQTWALIILAAATPVVLSSLFLTRQALQRRALYEAQLRKISTTDPLTGLPNRRALLKNARQSLELCKRKSLPFALAIMDLDHFKRINDSWGHTSGDLVLRKISRQLPQLLRQSDIIGRFGGEEFIIMLPGLDTQQAQQALERIRVKIQEQPLTLSEQDQITITASFGLSSSEKTQPETSLHDMVQLADEALYLAKDKGRNRVETNPRQV